MMHVRCKTYVFTFVSKLPASYMKSNPVLILQIMPMVMSSTNLHFVLIPWLAQGHMIPMIDIAHLLAARGVTVSLVTTPSNLSRIKPTVDVISESNLPIHFISLPFPAAEFGLPENCENMDSIPSPDLIRNFFDAAKSFKHPLILHLRDPNTPPASCIVSDYIHAWTAELAREFGLPRFIFQGFSCFAAACMKNLHRHKTHETVSSDSELFVVPGVPHRIELNRPQLPAQFKKSQPDDDFRKGIREAELQSEGILVNSFEELEIGYSGLLEKTAGKKVWMIGPVSMSSRGTSIDHMAERGNRSSIHQSRCLSWLDSKRPKSVVYVSFGSMGKFGPSQLVELGLGLLASHQTFIWVIKSEPNSEEMDKFLTENFADESRCLVIRGWAPQLMILSHPAVGGFMTHCGWNSTLEGICAGLPFATWPLFAEQFLNEKLLVEILRIGVSVGSKVPSAYIGHVKDEVVVKSKDVARAIRSLMDEEEGEGRRRRARELKEKATKAMDEGGSSHSSLTMLIEFVIAKATYSSDTSDLANLSKEEMQT